jgi:hypothetical protein
MITDTQRKNQILRKINRIPVDKLKELDDFVSSLEQGVIHTSKTLSFAGAWQDIDDAVFNDFTNDLINNRQRNRRRIDE